MPRKKKTPSQDATMQIQADDLIPGHMVCANDGTFCRVISIDPVVDIHDDKSVTNSGTVVVKLDRATHVVSELLSGTVTIKAA
jgi:hypothetical protein